MSSFSCKPLSLVSLALILSGCGAESLPSTPSTPVKPVTPAAPTAPVATSLSIVSGNNQTGTQNTGLSKTLVVQATAQGSAPVAGTEISFTVMSGGASVAPATAVTDGNGQASTSVKMGATTGPVQVSASVRGTSITTSFFATSIAAEPDSTLAATIYNPDWTDATHGKVSPNYAVVFPQDAVNSIEISLTTTQWASVRANMKSLYGYEFGAGTQGGAFPEDDPDYVSVPVKYNGKVWKKVGFRLKGNSTLAAAWAQGNYKLPFRLKLDEFEDAYPAIKNQRFYGFKELSFSPGRSDPSLIREKAAADILRMAGVNAARTAFYRIYIDFGAGLKYCGVYTGVEVIDDTMVKDTFGDDKGDIYKPESYLRTFLAAEFEKKNNKSPSDFSDVQSFISALMNGSRTTNPAQWRTNLQAVFNVEQYIKWLAVNNTIVNWDVYGALPHNYYLYNSPTLKLTWIPWDHNESLNGSPGIVGAVNGAGGAAASRGLSLSMNEVTSQWPLLRYIADDSLYFDHYKTQLRNFNANVFRQETMNAMFDKYTALISPYVVGANGEQPGYTYTSASQFNAALPALKAHVAARKALVLQYVP